MGTYLPARADALFGPFAHIDERDAVMLDQRMLGSEFAFVDVLGDERADRYWHTICDRSRLCQQPT